MGRGRLSGKLHQLALPSRSKAGLFSLVPCGVRHCFCKNEDAYCGGQVRFASGFVNFCRKAGERLSALCGNGSELLPEDVFQ